MCNSQASLIKNNNNDNNNNSNSMLKCIPFEGMNWNSICMVVGQPSENICKYI